MLEALNRHLTRLWRAEPLGSPLFIAALVTWLAVWVQAVGQVQARDPALAWPARTALLGFMASFLLTISADPGLRQGLFRLGLAGQAACAVALLSLGPTGSVGILLILLAATLTHHYPLRIELALLGAINGLFLAMMTWHWGWPPRTTLPVLFAWMGFQAFAVLTIRYAVRAERMAGELRTVNAGLLATRSLLSETARDQERLRLSRELHDVAGHKLTALKLNLRLLARDSASEGREALVLSTRLADELLEDLRAVVRHLRCGDGLDLESALARLAEPLPRPRVEFRIAPDARVPRAEQAEVLLRVAQEGLTNAARHGGARRAWIVLRRREESLELVVEDDGQVRWPLRPGNGLNGMRERLEAFGGTLGADPAVQGGLRLTARLPLEPPG